MHSLNARTQFELAYARIVVGRPVCVYKTKTLIVEFQCFVKYKAHTSLPDSSPGSSRVWFNGGQSSGFPGTLLLQPALWFASLSVRTFDSLRSADSGGMLSFHLQLG